MWPVYGYYTTSQIPDTSNWYYTAINKAALQYNRLIKKLTGLLAWMLHNIICVSVIDHITMEFQGPIERIILTSARSNIIILRNWFRLLVYKAVIKFHWHFTSSKFVTHTQFFVIPNLFHWHSLLLVINVINAGRDLRLADTRRSELPATVSKYRIILGIVHIVSINYAKQCVVTGDVSTYIPF